MTSLADPAAVQEISDWIVEQGLAGGDLSSLVEGLCENLVARGLPLMRLHVSMSTLHPQFHAIGCTWHAGRGLLRERYEHGLRGQDRWRQSPLRDLIEGDQPTLRRRLVGPDAQLDYPVLDEFRAQGATDWLGRLTRFGDQTRPSAIEGMAITWVSDAPDGFSETDVALIDRLVPRIGLACYRIVLEQIAINLLDAYVGADAGRRILSGQIERGAVERLRAVILFADLRGFTRVADATPGEELLPALNDYLGSITDAVLARGGEVLKFMGDGLLAVFSLEGREVTAVCGDALDAAEDALAANVVLNQKRRATGAPYLALDLALHLGEVLYGNVGSGQRLDFTVIGPAVNEAARIEALCEPLGRNLLLSAAFAEACGQPLEPLGEHSLRGVARPLALYGLP